MKTMHYLLPLLLSATLANAKVIRVDNNVGASADYVKLQDAINNADPGDSIYIMGSATYYDVNDRGNAIEIRLNKQVAIIGPGYFLGENGQTQANKQTAAIHLLNIGEGADNVVITGISFRRRTDSGIFLNLERLDGSQGSTPPQNITLSRNYIAVLWIYNASNTLIDQNFFSTNRNPIYLRENAVRTIIRNNILLSGNNSATIYGDFNSPLPNTVIANNTFSNGLLRISGATVQNNIFISGRFNDCDNNVVRNNLFTTTQEAVLPENSTGNEASNNIYSAVQANLFVSPDPSVDNQFQLAAQSPALGQGIEGVDLGAYGGAAPYQLSGLPAIPAIYELTTSGVGTPAEGMSVTIRAKSHN